MITGEWYNQNSRPILKSSVGNAVTADVETCDIKDSAVTAAKVTDGIVSSEKATANLRRKSVLLYFDGTSSTEAAGVAVVESTSLVAWRPAVNVSVTGVAHVALSLHGNATCDNFTLYGNAGTCIADVALKAVSTGIVRGTRTASGAITQAALAAGTNVLVKLNTSTCSQPGKAAIQIDYETSG